MKTQAGVAGSSIVGFPQKERSREHLDLASIPDHRTVLPILAVVLALPSEIKKNILKGEL
jgi:hypothetical protein